MEKSKFLGIIDCSKTIGMSVNNLANIWRQLLALCCLIAFYSCGLPNIIALHDPLTAEEHLNLGLSYEKRNEFDSAIKQYEMAAKNNPAAYLYLGNAYFQEINYKEAAKNYKESIRKDPQNADAYNNLAWLYCTKKENLDEAEKLVLKAIKINPSKENIYIDTLDNIKALNR